MIVNAKISRVARKIFFDNRAEVYLISFLFCKQINIAFKSSVFSAGMAHGMEKAHFELINAAEVQKKSYTEKAPFAVSHLNCYNAVLRKQ